jgi:hypothetical protein
MFLHFEAAPFRTERLEKLPAIKGPVGHRLLPVPQDIFRKRTKNESISIAYEFRTKSVESEGWRKRPERSNFGAQPACASAELFARSPWLLRFSGRSQPAQNVGCG